MSDRMIIVLARVQMTGRRETGKFKRYNGNFYPEYVECPEAKAMVWINDGDAADLEKAQAHANKENWEVFTFPRIEKEPLERAKALVLAEMEASK